MFVITTYKNGKTRRHEFGTMDEAKRWAAEFFRLTGIIVGIEQDEQRYADSVMEDCRTRLYAK